MTVLETFIAFAQRLAVERHGAIEDVLATVMESYSERGAFTVDELTELDRRMADRNPSFANPDDIAKLFGKPFSG